MSSMIFTHRSPRQYIFGINSRSLLPDLAKRNGSRILIVTDSNLYAQKLVKESISAITQGNENVCLFSQVQSEAPLSTIQEVLNFAIPLNIDLIIAIGGGSVIDTAKAVSLLLKYPNTISTYYGEEKVPGPTIPLIAVPTTAGTGSEVTPVAVVHDPDRPFKVGISSLFLIPTFAVIDPEFTLSAPASVIAYSGADALCHAIESYLAKPRTLEISQTISGVFVGQNDITDSYALAAIKAISLNLVRSWQNKADLSARIAMSQAAMWSGFAFGHAGTGCPHAMQYPIGALTHTPHGLGVGLLLPYSLTQIKNICASRIIQLSETIGRYNSEKSIDENVNDFVFWTQDLLSSVGIPTSLQEIGISESELPALAENTLQITRLLQNHPGKSDLNTMLMVLTAAWHGDVNLVHPD